MTPTVTFGNIYTSSIENKFITTEFLPCVRQFCDQDKVFCMNRFLSHLIRGKLCAFDAIWKWTDVYIWNTSILIHMFNIFFYQMIMMWKSGTGQNLLTTANSF